MLNSNPKINIDIVYENDDALFINKQAGIPVYPGEKNKTETIANGLVAKFPYLNDVDDENRAGITHRLDKNVSGILCIAKNRKAYEFIQNQFKERKTQKEYIAIVEGSPKKSEGKIETFIIRSKNNPIKRVVSKDDDGKKATTNYKLITSNNKFSKIQITPKTGRMHQIRVHMSHMGHPIVGDSLYGSNVVAKRIMLHAKSLELFTSKDHNIKVETTPPREFDDYVK